MERDHLLGMSEKRGGTDLEGPAPSIPGLLPPLEEGRDLTVANSKGKEGAIASMHPRNPPLYNLRASI